MKNDLTLSKIKNSTFPDLYNRFIIGETLSDNEYECILAIAICFINADDEYIQRLGYRIVVDYCNQKGDYNPLYEIAINKGLYPVSKYIELHYAKDGRRNFFTEWNDAFTEQYKANDIYQSEQQHEMTNVYSAQIGNSLSVIAPTSYGKSELIIYTVQQFAGKRVCILTSTKALLMQTKQRIQHACKDSFSKIIVHPEMYNGREPSCLAILTQERLLRLFKKDPHLSFDCIIIDEAHELLEDGQRGCTLASVLIVAQKRNSNVVFKFLTPFIAETNNLKTRYTSYELKDFRIREYIKTEKYFVYDMRNGSVLHFYDQFLDSFTKIESPDNITYENEIVKYYSAGKNIVYLNKPVDIEKFSLLLASILPDIESEKVKKACQHISDYLQPNYHLLTCLRKGIIYHHGSVPDAIRVYIEELYRNDPEIKYVVTSSTLLSGVNLPAERMFILDNRRGRANLSPNSFQNLVGRICRFKDIFDTSHGSLHRLEPQIYIVCGTYFRARANVYSYLKKVARADLNFKDEVENVLLENTKIDASNKTNMDNATEFIENYENGVVTGYKMRYTTTDVGKSCIMNGISEIDVFQNEKRIEDDIIDFTSLHSLINSPMELLNMIWKLFIQYIPDNGDENLRRLSHIEARSFYAMLFDWRINNKSYSEMIGLFVGYWRQCFVKDNNATIYVGRWGDTAIKGGTLKHYTKLANQNTVTINNLAIVRIKEEQDFIDNFLMKYVEVLHDMYMLEESFYAKIKYGTDNESIICLIKNGLSLSSAVLLYRNYNIYLNIDIDNSTVVYKDGLIEEMERQNENHIMIFEIKSCM